MLPTGAKEPDIEDVAIIDALLKVDSGVRYVAVLSDNLEGIAQKMKEGKVPYSPPFIDEVVVPIIAGMLKRLTEYAGSFQMCQMNYERVRLLVYRVRQGFVVVSAEPSVDMARIVEKVSKLT